MPSLPTQNCIILQLCTIDSLKRLQKWCTTHSNDPAEPPLDQTRANLLWYWSSTWRRGLCTQKDQDGMLPWSHPHEWTEHGPKVKKFNCSQLQIHLLIVGMKFQPLVHFFFSRDNVIKEERLKISSGKNVVKMEQGNKSYWHTEYK